MAEWSHRICERDWFDTILVRDTRPPGVLEDGTFRQPVQVVDAEAGPCCVCGGLMILGIYFRRHQDDLICRGRHEPEQLSEWSKVGLSEG